MDVEWTYQLEVVLHGFTPEGTSASIREVGDYQTIYTGFFGGGSEFSQPPPDDGVDVGEEHHRARQLRRHLLEHRQHTVCRRAARQRARRRCLKIICTRCEAKLERALARMRGEGSHRLLCRPTWMTGPSA